MILKEADEIITIYEDSEDKDCTCWQNAPCGNCENNVPKDLYEEAKLFIGLAKSKAILLLEELLEHELGDYSFKWEIKKDDIEFYRGHFLVDVSYHNIYSGNQRNSLSFKVNEDSISINKCDNIYEEIDIYEPSIKHLWIEVKWN